MRLPFGFYKGSPAFTVVKYVGGNRRTTGPGALTFYGPRTTLARVPATEQPFQYAFTENTADGQQVVVQGELHARLVTDRVLERRDFTIDPRTDAYLTDDPDRVENEASSALQTYVRREVQSKTLKDVLASATELERTVLTAIRADETTFRNLGLEVVNLFVTSVAPANKDLTRALEAEAREKMLAEADRALADRRQAAAESERALKTYEAETAVRLEAQRRALVEARNTNVLLEAEADAEAAKRKLATFKDADAATIFAVGFREMAANGRVGSFNVTPEVLELMSRASSARTSGNGH